MKEIEKLNKLRDLIQESINLYSTCNSLITVRNYSEGYYDEDITNELIEIRLNIDLCITKLDINGN